MIKKCLQEAFILKEKKHYKHALEVFYKALEYDNTGVEILVEIANLYYLMNNEERALSYIEQILEIKPMHSIALKLLQKIFEDKHAYQEAEQTAKNIYCISGKADDLVEIFRLLNIQKKYEESAGYKITHSENRIYLEQAKAFYKMELYEIAINILNTILLGDKTNQEALILLAIIFYKQNKKEECAEIVKQININKTNLELLFFLSQLETEKQNYDNAIEYLNLAIKKNSLEGLYYYNLGSIYYKIGDFNLAQKNYNLAITLEPDNSSYHFALANLYYSQKLYKRALEELNGDFFEAKLLKAIILYDTGYLALAKKELLNLEKEQPTNHIVKEYKSKISQELKII